MLGKLVQKQMKHLGKLGARKKWGGISIYQVNRRNLEMKEAPYKSESQTIAFKQEYYQDPNQAVLDQEVESVDRINERIRIFLKSKEKNMDEFDRILQQITMHGMEVEDLNVNTEFQNFDEINRLFEQRALNLDFPSTSFIVYLQHSLVINHDQKIVEELIKYGFDVIYDNLNWVSKITALGVVQELKVPYIIKLIDKVAVDILLQEYEDIIQEFTPYNILQAMTIFQRSAYQRLELWAKFDLILTNVLENHLKLYKEEGGDPNEFQAFDKQGLMILMNVLGEKRLINSSICQHLQRNVELFLRQGGFEISELIYIVDFYYRLNLFDSDHLKLIAQYILEIEMNPEDLQNAKSVLKLFRGLSNGEYEDNLRNQLFGFYMKCLEFYEESLTMSQWLTVLETLRMNTGQEKNIEQAKRMFNKIFDPEVFSTDGYGSIDSPRGGGGRKTAGGRRGSSVLRNELNK